MGIFTAAIGELLASTDPWREPQSFRDYCTQHNLVGRTQPIISVQTLSGLDQDLLAAKSMVFRLGGPGSTRFGLVRAETDVAREFFFDDSECFAASEPDVYLPDVSTRMLFPYQLLGSIEESGAVNLAVASGLLGHALGLDAPWPRIAPARGQSSYTFQFRPHASYDLEWDHNCGQVEIDTVILAQRNGRWKLFVVEAKHGQLGPGLAKHKLAYPVYAIASKPLPAGIEIVPVYLRSWTTNQYIYYGVAECEFAPEGHRSVSSLRVTSKKKVLALPFTFLH